MHFHLCIFFHHCTTTVFNMQHQTTIVSMQPSSYRSFTLSPHHISHHALIVITLFISLLTLFTSTQIYYYTAADYSNLLPFLSLLPVPIQIAKYNDAVLISSIHVAGRAWLSVDLKPCATLYVLIWPTFYFTKIEERGETQPEKNKEIEVQNKMQWKERGQ